MRHRSWSIKKSKLGAIHQKNPAGYKRFRKAVEAKYGEFSLESREAYRKLEEPSWRQGESRARIALLSE